MPLDLSEIYENLRKLPDAVEKAVLAYGKTAGEKLRVKAVEDRPWTDRTAHARQRLHSDVKRIETGIRIILAHGVEYGVYLELAHEKKYAVIYPTLLEMGPSVMEGLEGLFYRIQL